jgi:glycosyltransferase involved in cell wall biosynthesis
MTLRSSRPSVTAIVPTHNRRTTLQATLTSVLEQRDVDLHVIVVDDGSGDDTPTWLAGVGDSRLEVIRHEVPQGVSTARNAGLAEATTPYVAFCDDDDLWAPGKLAAQLDALETVADAQWSCTSSISFVAEHANIELVHHQPAPAAADVLAGLLSNNVIPGGGSLVLAATQLVRDVGGFHSGMAEDWDLWIRLGLEAPAAPVDPPMVAYRAWRTARSSRSCDLGAMEEGIAAVRNRYAEQARTFGIEQSLHADDAHLAKIALRGDLRRESFLRYAKLARRKPKKAAWAVGALVSPSAVDRATDRRSANSIPESWRTQVLEWLTPLLTEPALR